ncbi:M50 family metallopeptidase [Aquibacillus sp. 3ASR75-11]|uniref:M50 family metallopeptidase n=1 Tax=Terrihalobacillus insolitus TaxID=2950438 RepID=A0A9X4ANT2_9BACI|nr:M50 family metallopeptidase [Terrihalobacillus insolitus]MDC3413098.1 M50 family metallopeptidase [Terrihalobacillus insolitus]MDC3424840.1 M50 family metallopeptidase [Terrihalobacillus insolitus]
MVVYLIYLILIMAPLGLFAHELGHGLASLLLKASRVNLVLGSGKRLLTFKWNRLVITIHRVFFLGGYSNSERNDEFSRLEQIIICISGPLCNLIVAGGLSTLEIENNMAGLFILFNIWLGVINLIPFKIGQKPSDGYKIFTLLKKMKQQ